MSAPQEMRDEMCGWVEQQAAMGPRRPGSPAGHENEAFVEGKLREFGLERIRKEPIPITYWSAEESLLEVGDGDELSPIDHFPIPYTKHTTTQGATAPLIYVDPKTVRVPGACRGKIVVTDITFPPLDGSSLIKIGRGIYDPDNTLSDVSHPATWVRQGWHIYRRAARQGAVGFVGILRNQPGGTARMYAPYGFKEPDIMDKPLPGIWVGRKEGDRLRRIAQSDAGQAHMLLTGRCEPGVTNNVVGEVPGELDEHIVLSCHHDSPFVSPVEDGSGIAVVLALAKHFATERGLRRKLIVLLSAGHFYGSIGTRTFIDEHRNELLPKVACEISLEHMAREAIEDIEGNLVPSGEPEATGIFVPFNKQISEIVLEGVTQNNLNRALLLGAEGPLGDYPPTDGGDWYEAGVPVINQISNPVYLLTDDDALPWVDPDRMPKVVETYKSIIRALDQLPMSEIRKEDARASHLLMKLLKRISRAKSTFFGLRPVYRMPPVVTPATQRTRR